MCDVVVNMVVLPSLRVMGALSTQDNLIKNLNTICIFGKSLTTQSFIRTAAILFKYKIQEK